MGKSRETRAVHAHIPVDIFNPYNSADGLNYGLNCPLEYLQVYMTALVFLIFIVMIPIDCKLQIFPYIC